MITACQSNSIYIYSTLSVSRFTSAGPAPGVGELCHRLGRQILGGGKFCESKKQN